jgi:hypothetical protein
VELVRLADEAIERQATLATGDPTPEALRDARERLSAEREAFAQLTDPSAALEELSRRLREREGEGIDSEGPVRDSWTSGGGLA